MNLMLYMIGCLGLIISAVVGFQSGSLGSFFISMAGGISTAIIFFALAKILDFQADILNRLDQQEEILRRYHKKDNKVCPNCNNTYDDICTSCPYCGNRGRDGK